SPGTTMVREPRIFAEIGLFDTSLNRHEDWDWLLRLTARHDLAFPSRWRAASPPFSEIIARLLMRSKAFVKNTLHICRGIYGGPLRRRWLWKQQRSATGSAAGGGPHPPCSSRFGSRRSGMQGWARSLRAGSRGTNRMACMMGHRAPIDRQCCIEVQSMT